MSGERRDWQRLSARSLAPVPHRWLPPERPLRALPWPAALLLALVVAAVLVWSALPGGAQATGRAMVAQPASAASAGDLALYARIAERVEGGEGYYAAALAEQRAADYPTKPFVTVRLPTLAWLNAWAGRDAMRLAMAALLLANLAAWHRALRDQSTAPERIGAVVLVALGGLAALEPRAGLLHEAVAGLLLSLALALHRPGRAWAALLALAAALAVRELALPFALAWLALAAAERRWDEVRALMILLALFAAGMAMHYFAVEARLGPGDRASPGWLGVAGARFALEALVRFTPLVALPGWFAGPLAVLPLLGWLALGGRTGLVAAAWFTGMALMLAIVARPANFYWVLLALPAYGAGLAYVPRALADLARALALRARPG